VSETLIVSGVEKSGAEPGGGASFGSYGFFFSIFWRGICFEGAEKPRGDAGDFINGGQECAFVRFGGLIKTGDLPDELQRSSANFFGSDRWFEIKERLDIPAHR